MKCFSTDKFLKRQLVKNITIADTKGAQSDHLPIEMFVKIKENRNIKCGRETKGRRVKNDERKKECYNTDLYEKKE
jgi:hypothetical protein